MILRTILSGRAQPGRPVKKILHPYSGHAPDSLTYARNITIPPFEAIADMRAFRAQLSQAALRINRFLREHEHAILTIVAAETGSPIRYHREDMQAVRSLLRRLRSMETLLPRTYQYEAKGNMLLILSANEPIIEATTLIFAALYMGNVIAVKPSSKTPSYCNMLIRELLKTPALQKRVHYVLTDGEETERLIRARSFDFVLSLGSRATNRKLSIICAESEVEYMPESEGNDWVYVDKTCGSLEKIGGILTDAFTRHNGQMCNAVRGVLVHASQYRELADILKRNVSLLSRGDPLLAETRIGALIDGTQVHAHALIAEAAAGAEDIWSVPPEGNASSVTLIFNPDMRAAVVRESAFAPVLWVKKVRDHAEAISVHKTANQHGLGFSVYARDARIVAACARGIRAGRITINKHPLALSLIEPLGGIKLSGHGGPALWVEKCANRKYIAR